MSAEALEALARLPWPGNVRELRNILERLVIMTPGELIELRHLPASLATSDAALAPGDAEASQAARPRTVRCVAAREEFERRYIQRRYLECGGNMSRTAEVSRRRTLQPLPQDEGLRPAQSAQRSFGWRV